MSDILYHIAIHIYYLLLLIDSEARVYVLTTDEEEPKTPPRKRQKKVIKYRAKFQSNWTETPHIGKPKVMHSALIDADYLQI